MTDDVELRRLAIRRADMKLAFRSHLMAYVLVNAGLFAINVLSSPGDWWFYWPMLGWGIGLVFNAWDVYVRRPITESELQREIERLAHRR